MQTEVDLDKAVEAGIIGEDQALALRRFEAESAGASIASAEKFQFFGGLSDVTGAAGLGMVMYALANLAGGVAGVSLFAILPLLLFLLATKLKMRALPFTSMATFLGFEFFLLISVLVFAERVLGVESVTLFVIIGGSATFAGAWAFWKRFRFPPAPAAMALILTLALAGVASPEIVGAPPTKAAVFNSAILIVSLMVLPVAIWWDLTDIRRETERSQVAFWLHCCAGFLITRSATALITGQNALQDSYANGLGMTHAGPFMLVFALCAIASLILDRRSLLIGSIIPGITLFSTSFGKEEIGFLFGGFCLLLFTWGWARWREAILSWLPRKIVAQLPRTEIAPLGQRPTRRHLDFSLRKIW